MAAPDTTALQRSDLNQFLFAGVGTEANGTTLSVLSVFARLGSDPWQEAGRLSGLPRAEAADSLARMIAAMPKSLWPMADAADIAARLIGLLPERSAAIKMPAIRLPARRWKPVDIALAAAATALVAAVAVMLLQ